MGEIEFGYLQKVILTVIGGGMAGAGLTYILNLRREKRKFLFELHAKLNDSEMSKVRNCASAILEANRDTDLLQLKSVAAARYLKKLAPPEKVGESASSGGKSPVLTANQEKADGYAAEGDIAVWVLIRFYQRLAVAVRYRLVPRNLVPPLFGQLFVFWYKRYFEKQIVPYHGWSSAEDLRGIYKWLQKNTKQKKFEEWERLALDNDGNVTSITLEATESLILVDQAQTRTVV